jgi:hypothetical protein
MRSMSRILHALLVTGLFLVALPAQARKPLLGTVVDGGGKPIAGATVECVLAPNGPHLPPLPTFRASAVSADGKPVAGAEFMVAGYSWEGGQDKAADRLLGLLGQSWNDTLLKRGRSGGDGTFCVGIVPAGGWVVRGSFQLRGKQSDQFKVRVGDLGDVVVK